MFPIEFTPPQYSTSNCDSCVERENLELRVDRLEQLLILETLEKEQFKKEAAFLKNGSSALSPEEQEEVKRFEDNLELTQTVEFLFDVIKSTHHDLVVFNNRFSAILESFKKALEFFPDMEYIYMLLESLLENFESTCNSLSTYRECSKERIRTDAFVNSKNEMPVQTEEKDEEEMGVNVSALECLKRSFLESARGNTEILKEKEALEKENKTLKEKVQTNNSNSHLSSGSLPKFARVTNQRPPSDKKVGGQKGHEGSSAVINPEIKVDETVKLYPEGYSGEDKDVNFIPGERRYLLEEESKTRVVEFEQMCVEDDKTGLVIKAKFPPQIRANLQYGESFIIDAAILNTMGLMSASRTSTYIDEKYDVTLSASSVVEMVNKVAKKLAPFEELVRNKLIDSDVVYFDETPVNVKGKDVYVHVGCDKNYTLLKRGANRGIKGAQDLGIAQKFNGISMSDRFSLYTGRFFKDITKAFCGSHRIRDLNKAMLKAPKQTWPEKMLDVLAKMRSAARKARQDGLKEVPEQIRQELLRVF